MKVLIGGVLLVAFLGASSAEAWPWSRKGRSRDKLPKPIDYPIIRPKADDSHKIGSKGRHPSRYQRHEWGSEMGRFMKRPQHSKGVPYLYQE
jgi:hypothetical protein